MYKQLLIITIITITLNAKIEIISKNIDDRLIKSINSAVKSIDISYKTIKRYTPLYKALIKAKNRGITIKIVTNRAKLDESKIYLKKLGVVSTNYKMNKKIVRKYYKYRPYCTEYTKDGYIYKCIGYSYDQNSCVVDTLSFKYITFNGYLMGNKFVIIDNKKVFSSSKSYGDNGVGMVFILDDKSAVNIYKSEFMQMHRTKKFSKDKEQINSKDINIGKTKLNIYFTPSKKAKDRVIEEINSSKRDIYIAMHYLSNSDIVYPLIDAKKRGVNVVVLIDAIYANSSYSLIDFLRNFDIKVKVSSKAVKLKSALIDDKTLITGSLNWSSSGFKYNDGNMVIVNGNKKINRAYKRLFFELYNSIPSENVTYSAESLSSKGSCSDNIDNDYNGYSDTKDPHCKEFFYPKFTRYKKIAKSKNNRLIQGIVDKNGNKIYISPNSFYYDQYIRKSVGEKWFCSIYEAKKEGFFTYRHYYKYKK